MKLHISKCRVAALSCCALFSLPGYAADHSVDVVSLEVSRPVVLDPFNMPGTEITLDVALEGRTVLGLGGDSAMTTLRDDTGHDLLAEGEAKEAELERELVEAMGGMFGGSGTLTRKDTGGNIDHERAANMVDRERNAMEVPVITLGLPAKGATLLHLKGELAIQVAAAGERRIRVDGVTASEDWFVIEVEVEGRQITCRPDDYLETDDGTITLYYCHAPNLARVEVIGEAPAVPPGDYGQVNLFVAGVAENLSLEFIYPELETVRVPVDVEFGVGL